jgi:hypothetical protein
MTHNPEEGQADRLCNFWAVALGEMNYADSISGFGFGRHAGRVMQRYFNFFFATYQSFIAMPAGLLWNNSGARAVESGGGSGFENAVFRKTHQLLIGGIWGSFLPKMRRKKWHSHATFWEA